MNNAAANDEYVSRYFDVVQEEIKKLISDDKDIKPNQVQTFNDEIYNQPDEIKSKIKEYVNKASSGNFDMKLVAKEIYNQFKSQVKINNFTSDKVNDIPNSMVGERKFIKTFEQFIK